MLLVFKLLGSTSKLKRKNDAKSRAGYKLKMPMEEGVLLSRAANKHRARHKSQT